MLVILASRWNEAAKALAPRLGDEVSLLTPRDLSVAGWRLHLGGDEECFAVVDGKRVGQGEITGVLTLLPLVVPQELVHIVPADRPYIALEMTAFLLFWLSRLECPVLNRPTPNCLSGPDWRKEQWVHAACHAGIPARPVRRTAAGPRPAAEPEDDSTLSTVTVIGTRTFGEVETALLRRAERLAAIADVDLLSVRFSGSGPDAELIDADTFPDLSDDTLAGAVLEYLQGVPVVTP